MRRFFASLAVAALVMGCAQTPTLTKSGLDPENFIAERDGAKTALYTLTNKSGMEVCITNFGGRIVSVMVPDKNGEYKDVVLGFDKISDYFPENNRTDFGATIGRYANRINGGRFTWMALTISCLRTTLGIACTVVRTGGSSRCSMFWRLTLRT